MPTKNVTQSTNAYNTSANSNYNMFQGSIGNNLMQMVNNPLGNSFFKNQLAQQQGLNNQISQRSNSNLLQNMRAGGGVLSNSAGFMAGALNRNQQTNNMMQGNAFNSALNQALTSRNMGLASMQAYQPLQTGQTSTQTQSGLGTWLPQVAGMALGAATGGLFGGMGGSGGGGGASFMPSQIPSSYQAQNSLAPPPAFSGSFMNDFSNAVQTPYGGSGYGGR